MHMKTTLERAFELARGPECQSLVDIKRALTGERYTNVQAHLTGPLIRKQLRDLMNADRAG